MSLIMHELNLSDSSSSSLKNVSAGQHSPSEAESKHILSMINLNLQDATKQFNLFGQPSNNNISVTNNSANDTNNHQAAINSLQLNEQLKLGIGHHQPLLAHQLGDNSNSSNNYLHNSPVNSMNNKSTASSSIHNNVLASVSPLSSSTSSSTSHYINDILSRPAQLPPNLSPSAFGNALPRFALSGVSNGVCFNAAAATAAAAAAANGLGHKIGTLNDLQSRHIYWPSMVQNSNLWRERIANAGKLIKLLLQFVRNCFICFFFFSLSQSQQLTRHVLKRMARKNTQDQHFLVIRFTY